MKETIKISKPELYTKEIEFEVDTNEFYWKFYNECNP